MGVARSILLFVLAELADIGGWYLIGHGSKAESHFRSALREP